MNSRFSLSVVVLAMVLAIVLGVGMLGALASFGGGHSAGVSVAATAFVLPALAFFLAGGLVGALVWCGFFLVRRDGWHRLEWTAFLPFNYGGRSPFDTSPHPRT